MIVAFALLLAAFLVAFWVWLRELARRDLEEMAFRARMPQRSTDPWEEPRVMTPWGIHDVEEDDWR